MPALLPTKTIGAAGAVPVVIRLVPRRTSGIELTLTMLVIVILDGGIVVRVLWSDGRAHALTPSKNNNPVRLAALTKVWFINWKMGCEWVLTD